MGVEIQDGQASLIDKVIDRGICVRCGACVGLCPYFGYFDGKVVVMDRCNADSSRCLQLCPRAGYEGTSPEKVNVAPSDTSEIGPYQDIMIARASKEEIRKGAQYGGTVSALVIYAIEKGRIKSAVLTDIGGPRSPGGIFTQQRHKCWRNQNRCCWRSLSDGGTRPYEAHGAGWRRKE